MTPRRPGFAQWLGYTVFGRRLPGEYREWVRRDLVGPRAVPRHLARSMVPFVPIFVVFVVAFPGPLWLRGAMVLLSVLLALFFAAAYMEQNRKRRLELHGLPTDLRSERAIRAEETERERYERRHRA